MMMRSVSAAGCSTRPSTSTRPSLLKCSRQTLVVARSGDGSVQDLLARDFKQPKVVPELQDGGGKAEDVLARYENNNSEVKAVVKSKRQRRSQLEKEASSEGSSDSNLPKKCKEAIDRGLALFQEKQYKEAISMFNLALELPGNGAYRLPSSPREFSCPSDAEEAAALFNMACCYAQMGQRAAALTCLDGLLENGFDDYNTIRTDADLAPIRGPELNALLDKYDGLGAKLKNMMPFGAKKSDKVESDPNKPKSWLQW